MAALDLHIIQNLAVTAVIAPLIGALAAGLAGKQIGRRGAHTITIFGIAVAFVCSLALFNYVVIQSQPAYNFNLYTWATAGNITLSVGFLIDRLSAIMMVTVCFISLLVHIYSIGYMREDSGYQRFFSYMSLFTFAMLSLVVANNFGLLFFGWEGVGLVSYLLIGFWFKKESAVQGSLKAFLVNRVGDFGFIIGIAAILAYVGSLDYGDMFAAAPKLATVTVAVWPHFEWSILTVIGILLFVGAMGKSAQVPLHVWLPESMEGPTPISALIHAATMVTAGVYMVARLSPMYQYSPIALSMVLIVGATGALFMGILGLVQNDIKRVIAYSTMSQLGYMMAAAGASAYAASMFHLITHACFKALLFLAAGSVIIMLHHEQNLWKMGNLRKYMPITYLAFLIGALSLSAIPPFAGYYSKDSIIEAVHLAALPGAKYAYIALLIATFITALYIFRAFFLAFHGKERMDESMRYGLHEAPYVVTVPLIILMIPSVFLGMALIGPMLYQTPGMLADTIYVPETLKQLSVDYPGALLQIKSAFTALPFWFGLAGILIAWLCYVRFPAVPVFMAKHFRYLYYILIKKYGFDAFNHWVFVRGGRGLSNFFFHYADLKLIDGLLVNGSGRAITRLSSWLRRLQSGYLYHYAFAMILGLCVFLGWLLLLR